MRTLSVMEGEGEPDARSLRPVTGGAVMSAVSRVAVAASGAITSVAVARLLGAHGTGAYAIAATVTAMLVVFSTLGVEHGIAYFVSAGRWDAHSALRQSLVVAGGSGLVAALVGLSGRLLFPSAFAGLTVAQVAIVVAALPFALALLYTIYIALSVSAYEAFVIPPAAVAVCALVLVSVGAATVGETGVVLGLTLAQAMVCLVTLALASRWLPPRNDEAESSMLGPALRFGLKGYAGNALQFVNFRFDVLILSAVAGAADVGIYSVAVAITGLVALLPPALSDVVFPRVAALSASDDADAEVQRAMVEEKGLKHVVVAVLATGLAVVAALIILVVPFYGEAFKPAIVEGLILLPGAALLGIASVLAATIVGRGFPQYGLYIALAVTPTTVLLYAILIPALGANGAALASSASYAASFAGMVYFYRRATGCNALVILMPTRQEFEDYRRLPGAVREWRARATAASR